MSLSDKTKHWLEENCNTSLKGKTVLVTGANSGVGFKTAEIAVSLGSIIGPNKGFGGWRYPEMNCVGHCVKEGAEELIRFTNIEIEKAKDCTTRTL